jgi:hypothetical protein
MSVFGKERAVKQSTLLRWIETAESARFCRLAEEDPRRVTIEPTPTSGQPLNPLLAGLREQLCLSHAIDRLSRFGGLRTSRLRAAEAARRGFRHA